jgi:hypothetical protein
MYFPDDLCLLTGKKKTLIYSTKALFFFPLGKRVWASIPAKTRFLKLRVYLLIFTDRLVMFFTNK